jgi:hypothetical protein
MASLVSASAAPTSTADTADILKTLAAGITRTPKKLNTKIKYNASS